MTRLAETFNEYGTPVTLYKCDCCGGTFTVCPAMKPEQDFQWTGCLGVSCASYDEARDAEKMFDQGRVYRVGDRSQIVVAKVEHDD